MKKVSKVQFVSSMVWRICDTVFAKGANALFSLLLARWLLPEYFGLITICVTIQSFADVIVTSGLNTVLVQKQDVATPDWSSAIGISFIRALFLYAIVFIVAPFVGAYYDSAVLTSLLRVLSLEFFAQVIIAFYTAIATRKMAFKQIFFADLISTLIAGCVSCCMALKGCGVWSLLAHTLCHQCAYAAVIILLTRERVGVRIYKDRLTEMTPQGFRVLSSSLLDLTGNSIVGLFVGKKWDVTNLGYLNRAEKLTQTVGVESYNVVSGLLLPTFASYQNDRGELKLLTRRFVALTCYIMFPLMLGLGVYSKEIVTLLLTEKWLPCVPLIQLLCVYYAMNPLRQLCSQLNYSTGSYKTNQWIELFRFCLLLAAIVVNILIKQAPLYYMIIATSTVAVVIAGTYMASVHKTVDYKLKEMLADILPSIALSVIAMAPILLLRKVSLPLIVFLLVGVLASVCIYVALSAVVKLKIFCYLRNELKQIITRKKPIS